MAKNYYDLLGVSKDADAAEIKKSFRKLAKQYHPDSNKEEGAEQKFKDINEAFSVLSDPEKRKQYDQFGFDGSKADGGGMGGYPGMGGYGGMGQGFSANMGDFGDLGDLLGGFFGGGSPFSGGFGGQRVNNNGADLSLRVDVSFEDAVFGAEKNVTYVRKDTCDACKGSGSANGKKETCSTCNGVGKVRQTRQTMFGTFATEAICPTCHGSGEEIKDPCSNCDGTGRVTKSTTTKIKIPAGAETGVRLRFQGKGDAGIRGGDFGDLYVVLSVKEHKLFKRNNGDIYIELPISPALAVLGGEIEVPTVNSNVKMKIPKGTQGGTDFRLKGKGGPRLRGSGVGDQFVKVYIDIPKSVSSDESKVWEKLLKEGEARSKGFWEKLLE